MASPTNVVDILVQIFDGYPTLTEDIDCTDFTLKEYVLIYFSYLCDTTYL